MDYNAAEIFDEYDEEYGEMQNLNVEKCPTIRVKRNKRSRYLEGVKLARKHWQRMYEERDPGSPNPRREITSWMSPAQEEEYKESAKKAEDPTAAPREKWFATYIHKHRKHEAERKMRNFGKFRSTRPNFRKDTKWDTMQHAVKERRQADRLSDSEKDFRSSFECTGENEI